MLEVFATYNTFMAIEEMGIDIVGLLTTTQGSYKYVVVAVEYFTKCIEVKPLVNIAAVWLKRFF
jgi:hypothetical protein